MSWNRSNSVADKVDRSKNGVGQKICLFVVSFFAVGVSVGLVVFLFHDDATVEKTDKKEKQGLIKAVQPASAPKFAPVEVKPVVDDERKRMREKVAKMTREEKEAFAWEQLQKKKIDLEPKTNRPFRTSLELQMARIFTTELGNRPPPPMPPIAPLEMAHLTEILIADNPGLPTDTDQVKEGKAILQIAKKELKKYIKEGGDPDNFINHYYGILNDAFQERQMCMQEIMRSAKESPEIVGELCDKYNERLSQKGIKKIELSEKVRRKLGLED